MTDLSQISVVLPSLDPDEKLVAVVDGLSQISVVLPSLDPDEKLVAVVDGLLEYGFSSIILVNDGSKPENLHYFTDLAARHPEIHLLHHEVNKGKGAALKNAFRYFLDHFPQGVGVVTVDGDNLAARHPEIHLLHHEVNKGKGAALKNAFRYFLDHFPQGVGVVTVDGDNQHHPADTRACCEHMLQTGHTTLGCRDFTLDHVPGRSRFGNHMTSAIFKIFVGMTISDTQTGLRAIPRDVVQQLLDVSGDRFEYETGNHMTSAIFKIFVGMTISDTQTGLRAIPRDVVQQLLDVSGDRFEYETNMLLAFKTKGIPFDEVKIRTVYIEENKSSHFRVIQDSWRIYKLILAHFFRYTLSSFLSAGVDVGVFALLTALLAGRTDPAVATVAAVVGGRAVSSLLNFCLNRRLVFRTNIPVGKALLRYYCLADPAVATVAAVVGGRAVSSLLNFCLNRRLVFRTNIPVGKALLRYYCLALPQMVVQALLDSGIFALFQVSASASFLRTLIHTVVMVVLYFVSYMIQQRWVFAPEKSK